MRLLDLCRSSSDECHWLFGAMRGAAHLFHQKFNQTIQLYYCLEVFLIQSDSHVVNTGSAQFVPHNTDSVLLNHGQIFQCHYSDSGIGVHLLFNQQSAKSATSAKSAKSTHLSTNEWVSGIIRCSDPHILSLSSLMETWGAEVQTKGLNVGLYCNYTQTRRDEVTRSRFSHLSTKHVTTVCIGWENIGEGGTYGYQLRSTPAPHSDSEPSYCLIAGLCQPPKGLLGNQWFMCSIISTYTKSLNEARPS